MLYGSFQTEGRVAVDDKEGPWNKAKYTPKTIFAMISTSWMHIHSSFYQYIASLQYLV